MEALLINDTNNRYEFRIDSNTTFVYGDCLETAKTKLEKIFGTKIEIKDEEELDEQTNKQ